MNRRQAAVHQLRRMVEDSARLERDAHDLRKYIDTALRDIEGSPDMPIDSFPYFFTERIEEQVMRLRKYVIRYDMLIDKDITL